MAPARYADSTQGAPSLGTLPAAAMRECLREGYGGAQFRRDLMAGVVVGIVALPLSMALAVAVGVAPQHGIYTAIAAGFVTALLGGSRTQVTGPTAAFLVILAPIVARHGLEGLLISGLMGGVILMAMGLMRLGRLIEFIPHPVTTGFTAGIAVVIATLQMKDLFGLQVAGRPDHYVESVGAMWAARGTFSWSELGTGLGTLLLLIVLPRITKRVPAALIALPLAALGAWAAARWVGGYHVATIASRFAGGIPQAAPTPLIPWHVAGPGGGPSIDLSFDLIRQLIPSAFAVAMLGAIESLLAAVVADGMARTRHNPDAELIALGAGNIIAPFLGGIPATGAIARTATNIRSGARSPVASMVHAATILVVVLALAPLIGRLPMASLAALLLVVAWNMSEARHFVHTLRVAPKSDAAVLLTCFGLTVAVDMVASVFVGVVLAALLFMKRMAAVTQATLITGTHPELPRALPAGVAVYDIDGPLFFGAAQKAMGALGIVGSGTRVVVLRMDEVPMIDATGLVALESAIERLGSFKCAAVISGLQPQPARLIANGRLLARYPRLTLQPDIEGALREAEDIARQPRTTVRRLAKP